MTADATWLLAQADARRCPLASGSVQCVVTSPPYYGLRDYGTAGQIGLEPTPAAYVAAMVDVFREVRRVLRDDGTVWLNVGDSYANDAKWGGATGGKHATGLHGHPVGRLKRSTGLKPKDLIGIPWALAFALRDDGWFLRSEIIWAKPNPMPESVTDRPTKAHEQVFLLTKRERYFYDADAVREARKPASLNRYQYGLNTTAPADGRISIGAANPRAIGHCERMGDNVNPAGRNCRSVWSITTEPVSEAHFATMPTRLVLPCVLAGTSERGACPACGAPWVRETESERVPTRPGVGSKVYIDPPVHPDSPVRTHHGDVCGNRDPMRHVSTFRTLGWSPSCACPPTEPVPCVVYDPFAGSGTVPMVAARLGRRGVGTDLSAAYLAIAARRIPAGLRPKSKLDPATVKPLPGQLSFLDAV